MSAVREGYPRGAHSPAPCVMGHDPMTRDQHRNDGSDILPRDGGLLIRGLPGVGDSFLVVGKKKIEDRLGPIVAPNVHITEGDFFERIQKCYEAWARELIGLSKVVPGPGGRGQKKWSPFVDGWDLSDPVASLVDDAEFRGIGGRLALAGRDLFRFLFLEPERGEEMNRIGQVLRSTSRSGRMVMTMTSADRFIPWPMIYTHVGPGDDLDPDGGNFHWEGFWGYRHRIEHEIEDQTAPARIDPGQDGKVVLGFQADTGLDVAFGITCVKDQSDFFMGLPGVHRVERFRRNVLERAIRLPDFCDQVMYFYCHHVGTGDPDRPSTARSKLVLSEGDVIDHLDFENWLDGKIFRSRPVVFLNACQGGQLSTMFYKTIAHTLLKRRARCVIGPHIEIPARFAAEYARRFFTRFLGPGPPARVGDIVCDLAREFVDVHRNPLGLAYSIYQGLDCYVHR